MSLRLSLHARQRMSERGISHSELRECLRCGQELAAEPEQRRLRYRDLIMVLSDQLVITVFRRPSLIQEGRTAPVKWSLASAFQAAMDRA